MVLLAILLVACGVKTEDYDKMVANRDELYGKWVSESNLLKKANADLETTKHDLLAEIKAKQAHAVREEQAKQRLKQAERDLAAALRELSVFKGKKK
jgi:hypothetical protein